MCTNRTEPQITFANSLDFTPPEYRLVPLEGAKSNPLQIQDRWWREMKAYVWSPEPTVDAGNYRCYNAQLNFNEDRSRCSLIMRCPC
jgi:hypothetical protein